MAVHRYFLLFSQVSNNITNYGRRHLKLSINCHVLRDTLQLNSQLKISIVSKRILSLIRSFEWIGMVKENWGQGRGWVLFKLFNSLFFNCIFSPIIHHIVLLEIIHHIVLLEIIARLIQLVFLPVKLEQFKSNVKYIIVNPKQ